MVDKRLRLSLSNFGRAVAYASMAALSMGLAYVLFLFFATLPELRINAFAKALTLTLLLALTSFVFSTWFWTFRSRKLTEPISFWRFGVGQRPSAPEELSAWRWARFLLLSWTLALACVAVLLLIAKAGLME